jgi:hypothetical protein
VGRDHAATLTRYDSRAETGGFLAS